MMERSDLNNNPLGGRDMEQFNSFIHNMGVEDIPIVGA